MKYTTYENKPYICNVKRKQFKIKDYENKRIII